VLGANVFGLVTTGEGLKYGGILGFGLVLWGVLCGSLGKFGKKCVSDDYAGLVEQARRGDKDALDRLAEAGRVCLEEYVLRLTLSEDLTQDIVQESILEMYRVFDKLKKAERFRPWLYGIAFNKLRSHYGERWRHRTVSLSGMEAELAGRDGKDGLADMVTRELSWSLGIGLF